MCRQNHGVAADYFAVGVIAYECMNGRRPYVGKSRREIREQILARQVHIKRYEIPDGWSLESADFINKVTLFWFCFKMSLSYCKGSLLTDWVWTETMKWNNMHGSKTFSGRLWSRERWRRCLCRQSMKITSTWNTLITTTGKMQMWLKRISCCWGEIRCKRCLKGITTTRTTIRWCCHRPNRIR